MSTATLPSLAEIRAAAHDDETYCELRARLTESARRQFDAEVDEAYTETHPTQRLTERAKRMLQFAGRTYRTPGAREQAIREQFGISATRYYQILGWLIDQPQALAYAPVIVNRLRAQREAAQGRRSARQLDARSAA